MASRTSARTSESSSSRCRAIASASTACAGRMGTRKSRNVDLPEAMLPVIPMTAMLRSMVHRRGARQTGRFRHAGGKQRQDAILLRRKHTVAWASCPCEKIQQDMGRMPMPREQAVPGVTRPGFAARGFFRRIRSFRDNRRLRQISFFSSRWPERPLPSK